MLEFYAANKFGFWCGALIAVIAVCAVHYFFFGRRGTRDAQGETGILITRFTIREQIFHWLRIILFLFLLGTGIKLLLQIGETELGPHHGFTGVAFVILVIINLVSWAGDMLPRRYDLSWFINMGGYLSRYDKHLPAGRFNAGQKVYFWLMFIAVMVLMTTAIMMEQEPHHTIAGRQSLVWIIHGLTGCLAAVMVIGHAYLSILVNPESARVLLDGKIRRDYIMKHHGLWLDPALGQERSKPDDLCPSQK
ncbi:MAG: cytochrome b/b6 domain-containing protein [Deltaproteobacteria bacterium]